MKFTRYMMWNFLKMFLIVLLGAILMFAVIDFVLPDFSGGLVYCGACLHW